MVISKEDLTCKEKNRVYKNFILKEGNFEKRSGPRAEKKLSSSSQVTKRESINQPVKYSRKNVTNPNLNSTAVTNSEISGKSFINEKCPEVETLKHSILISNNPNQLKLVQREDNTLIKSPKIDIIKRKNLSLANNTHDTEMDLRLMKHDLERDLDL
jgi:hypothetical protein